MGHGKIRSVWPPLLLIERVMPNPAAPDHHFCYLNGSFACGRRCGGTTTRRCTTRSGRATSATPTRQTSSCTSSRSGKGGNVFRGGIILVSLGGQAPHVLGAHVGRTCGEPNEFELTAFDTLTGYVTFRFQVQPDGGPGGVGGGDRYAGRAGRANGRRARA